MFSVILSLYANFDHIKSYLKQFTVILISKTWINNEREIEFGIEGYEFICMNRTNKHGGGVAINCSYKVTENKSMHLSDCKNEAHFK